MILTLTSRWLRGLHRYAYLQVSMNKPDIHIAASWGARRQSLDECVDRVSMYYKELAEVSSYLSNWRSAGKTKPMLDFSDPEIVVGLLKRGQNCRDIGGDVMPELGYSITTWNAERELTAQSRVQCGLFTEVGLKNRSGLSLSQPLAKELGEPRLLRLLEIMVEIWSPSRCSIYVFKGVESTDTQVLMEYSESQGRVVPKNFEALRKVLAA
jgi:hypothetical protein